MRDLVSTAELAARLGEPDLRVAGVRCYLDPALWGRVAHQAGHIPEPTSPVER